jgi:type II secretory pathway component GspD/PulD (secretin)
MEPRRLASPECDSGPLITRVYRTSDVLAALRMRHDVDEEGAKELLTRRLIGAKGARFGLTEHSIRWFRDELVVRAVSAAHEHTAATLRGVRDFGIHEIVIEARIVTGPPESINAVGTNWTILPSDSPHAETPEASMQRLLESIDRPPSNIPDKGSGRGRLTTQTVLPVKYEVLDGARVKEVLDHLEADRDTNVVMCPKIATLSGQTACISDCAHVGFIVGVTDGQPKFRMVPDGLVMRLRPLARKDETVRLDCELKLSNVCRVETTTISRGPSEKAINLQIPEVQVTHLETSVELPLGQTLMIGGLETEDDKNKRQSMLVLLRASKFGSDQADPSSALGKSESPQGPPPLATADDDSLRSAEQAPDAKVPLLARVYAVADLVVPVPKRIVVSDLASAPADPPPVVEADFEPLVDLITSSVQPASWESVGGEGLIRPFEENLSLVVRQTQEVHEEIIDVLEQLRLLQDIRVELTTTIVELPDDAAGQADIALRGNLPDPDERHTTLTQKETRSLLASVQANRESDVRQTCKVTLFNGQQVEIRAERAAGEEAQQDDSLVVQSAVTDDRRGVRLTWAVDPNALSEKLPDTTTVVVPDGDTLVVDITRRTDSAEQKAGTPLFGGKIPYLSRVFRRAHDVRPAQRTLALFTPRIVIQDEEEEKLGEVGD